MPKLQYFSLLSLLTVDCFKWVFFSILPAIITLKYHTDILDSDLNVLCNLATGLFLFFLNYSFLFSKIAFYVNLN